MAIRKAQLTVAVTFAAILTAMTIAFRLTPHVPNVAPIGALAIFSGALLPKRIASIFPLVAVIISDLVIGLHSVIFFTWGSYILIAILAPHITKKLSAINIIFTSLCASLIFFVLSNFGVWLDGRLYPRTFQGLAQCYFNALPFFRNTVFGDLAFTFLFISVYVLSIGAIKHWRNHAKDSTVPVV